jgi:hypothetical protein
MTVHDGALAIWGILVGFVGWGSCFRLVGPVSDWLLPLRSDATFARGLTRLLVLLFLMFAILLSISLVALVNQVAAKSPGSWRHDFGVSFKASIAGVLLFGITGRLSRNRSKSRRK